VTTAKPGLRHRLTTTDEFVTVTELVPWRGATADRAGRAGLDAAHELVDDPRIAALSVTDNAGGHAMVSPALVAEEFLARGQDVIVHVACRDRSRNGLTSLAWELQRRGVRNVLAVSGDLPVEGYQGLSRPVFDVDSVGLLALYRGLERDGGGDVEAPDGPAQPAFYLGCAVSPFKRLEAEVVPQYLKLALKVRAGADFIIPQLGYDTRAWDELLRWMRRADLRVPVLANVYVLSRTVARLFHGNAIPGCVVSDELLAVAEREAAAPDKGRAFFLELAAKQVAIARGLGFRGVYLAGHRSAADIARVLDTAAQFAPDDWRAFAKEIAYGPKHGFRMFGEDPATGLATDDLEPTYAASLTARERARRGAAPPRGTGRTGSRTGSSSRPARPRSGLRAACTGSSSRSTLDGPYTSWSRPSRCRSTTAGTAAIARCRKSRTSARSPSARRASGTARAAVPTMASASWPRAAASGSARTSA